MIFHFVFFTLKSSQAERKLFSLKSNNEPTVFTNAKWKHRAATLMHHHWEEKIPIMFSKAKYIYDGEEEKRSEKFFLT